MITETGKNERDISVSIYITVGLLRSLGMSYIAETGVIDLLKDKCFTGKKIDPVRK